MELSKYLLFFLGMEWALCSVDANVGMSGAPGRGASSSISSPGNAAPGIHFPQAAQASQTPLFPLVLATWHDAQPGWADEPCPWGQRSLGPQEGLSESTHLCGSLLGFCCRTTSSQLGDVRLLFFPLHASVFSSVKWG